MIKPLLQDEALLDDVRRAPASERSISLWWLGQSGFLLKYGNRVLVFDPYLSDSLTRKYAATDKPHTRMSEVVVRPERLDFVDVVTSSHNHTDHLDADTLLPMMRANPGMRLVTAAANKQFAAERLGVDPMKLLAIDAGQSITVGGFDILAVPAAHTTIERDEQGRFKYVGYVVTAGWFSVYHGGDTVWDDAIVAALAGKKVDVALLPINGDRPERRVAGNLDGPAAARLAKAIGAGVVVPCHYDLFEFNTASPESFVEECERIGQAHRVLRLGERMTLSA
jgi:L-ascorbate metabolism protein UlaG (beta-lactamase superfamily)